MFAAAADEPVDFWLLFNPGHSQQHKESKLGLLVLQPFLALRQRLTSYSSNEIHASCLRLSPSASTRARSKRVAYTVARRKQKHDGARRHAAPFARLFKQQSCQISSNTAPPLAKLRGCSATCKVRPSGVPQLQSQSSIEKLDPWWVPERQTSTCKCLYLQFDAVNLRFKISVDSARLAQCDVSTKQTEKSWALYELQSLKSCQAIVSHHTSCAPERVYTKKGASTSWQSDMEQN